MNHQSKLIAVLLFITILAISCSRNKLLMNEIKQMQSVPFELCLDSMLYYSINTNNSDIDSISFYDKNIALIVYLDSKSCSPCAIKGMYRWFELLDTIKLKYENELKVYFMFAFPKDDLHNLYRSIETSSFDYPIFIDTTNVFKRRNKHLPENPRMHTFMLDRKRNVILVGSPLDNESIRKLFFKIANDSIIYD